MFSFLTLCFNGKNLYSLVNKILNFFPLTSNSSVLSYLPSVLLIVIFSESVLSLMNSFCLSRLISLSIARLILSPLFSPAFFLAAWILLDISLANPSCSSSGVSLVSSLTCSSFPFFSSIFLTFVSSSIRFKYSFGIFVPVIVSLVSGCFNQI
jgi:hypothetical protein